MSGRRIIEAIGSISRETGYPPSPEELAQVLDISIRSLHSTLLPYKRTGEVGYDEDGNFVLREGV